MELRGTAVGLFYMWVCHFTCYTRSQVIHRFLILIKTHCCPFVVLHFPFYALATCMSLHAIANENGKLGETNYIKT